MGLGLPAGVSIEPVDMSNPARSAEIICASWKQAYRGIVDNAYLDSLTPELWLKAFGRESTDPARFGLYLIHDGKAIGTARYGRSSTTGYLDDGELTAIYFLPEGIGLGFGRYLFEAVEGHLSSLGYSHLVLGVFSLNSRAIRFYQRQGMQAVKLGEEILIDNQVYQQDIMRKLL